MSSNRTLVFASILADVSEVIEDQRWILSAWQWLPRAARSRRAVWSRWTRSVVRVNSTRQPLLHQRQAERGAKVRFARASGPNRSRLAPFSSQLSPAANAMTCALLIIGHRIELEAVERLAGWQAGFVEMTLDAAAGEVGHLVLGERGQEAGGRPALLVGSCGEVRPDELDRGQAEIGEGQS